MALTREEIEQFIEALQSDAELRDRVRDAILEDDFRALPGIVRQLAERLDRLTERVDALTERLDRLTERLDRLTERVERLTEQMDRLVRKVDNIDGRLGNVEGWQFEHRYLDNLAARLGTLYRRVREVVIPDEEAVATALHDGALTREDYVAVLNLDRVVRARTSETAEEVIVALEISMQVDESDVQRAHDRAATLARVFGTRVDAVVAGRTIVPEASKLARDLAVLVLDAREESAA